MDAQQDQNNIPAMPQSPRWPAGRRRAAGAALAASAWAATVAAALAGSHPGHGAGAQIAFAAIMATFAMGETLFPPALLVIINDPASPGAPGRYNRRGTLAFTAGCMLVLIVGALGADWRTSLLSSLAVACAIASSAVHRLGRGGWDLAVKPFRRAASRCRWVLTRRKREFLASQCDIGPRAARQRRESVHATEH
jgi:hypothetical protein